MNQIKTDLLVLLIFFLSAISFASSWYSIEPRATDQTLFSIHFPDSLHGWAAGANGVIINSKDGGNIWTAQNSTVTDSLLSICFADSLNGWAVGKKGCTVNTIDGGKTWVKQLKRTTGILIKVFFSGKDTGYIVTSAYPPVVFKTQNGGLTWANLTDSIKNNLFSAFFIDANHFWLGGENGSIIKTKDGGNNWQNITPQNWDLTNWMFVKNVFFLNDSVGWAYRWSFGIYTTNNAGKDWLPIGTPDSLKFSRSANYVDFAYLDNNTGFLVSNCGMTMGYRNTVGKTIDGGKSWVIDNSFPLISEQIYSIFIDKRKNGWVTGDFGAIFTNKSKNSSTRDESFHITGSKIPLVRWENNTNLIVSILDNTDKICLFDCTGRLLSFQGIKPALKGANIYRFSMAGTPNGVYFLVLKDDAVQQKTIIITKK